MKSKLSSAGAALGRVKSHKKAAAARENGAKGGRPAIRRSFREMLSDCMAQTDKTDEGLLITLRLPLLHRYLLPGKTSLSSDTHIARTKDEWVAYFREVGHEL